MKMKNSKFLRDFIFETLAEARKYVYHASPKNDIEHFIPQTFAHTPDFSHSGRWSGKEPLETGWETSDLVFATNKENLPFYGLPRETPRILVNLKDKVAKSIITKMIKGFRQKRSKVIFLPSDQKSKIESHTWTEYALDKTKFSKVPGSFSEFISKEKITPSKKQELNNPIKRLESRGYQVQFIDNIYELYKELSKNEQIGFQAEGNF